MSDTRAHSAAAAKAAPAPPPHAQVIQMALALVVSRAIFAVAELGVADQLQHGPRSADDIAEATGAHAPSVYRLLRTLAGVGFFVEDEAHRFSATPLGAALQTGAPGYARSTVRALAGPMAWGAWGEFLHAVRTGEPAMDKAFGQPIFDYLSMRPEDAARFNETMIGFHGEEPPAVAAAYDFSGMRRVIDIGGGTGNLLTTIVAANPGSSGVLFDLPHVASEARRAIDAKGLSARCTVVEGSFFDDLPSGGDAYMLSHIIHDWDDARSLAILGNCRRAMQGQGRVLLVESVIPPGNDFHPGKLLDLIMLTFTPGGRERTEQEYRSLFARGGFRLTRIVPTASAVSVIEAEPLP